MSHSTDLFQGVLIILAGAFANGSFGLVLKWKSPWKWEHMWLAYSFFAMLIIPWLLGLATVPHMFRVLASADSSDLVLVFLYGLGWGIGSVLYGIALRLVGLGLSYAIVMGLTAAVGSIAPLVLLHRQELGTTKGLLIVLGVAVAVTGVLFSAWAGQLKADVARRMSEKAGAEAGRNFIPGLIAALLSGVLSPMLNLSFAYGEPLASLAVKNGTTPLFAANVIWTVALSAGFITNAGYCLYLIHSGRSARLLAQHGTQYAVALLMALLWSAGYICYGFSGSRLGELAAVVGWPLMTSMTILTANFWSVVYGEWKDAGGKSRRIMAASVALLCAGMIIIGKAASL